MIEAAPALVYLDSAQLSWAANAACGWWSATVAAEVVETCRIQWVLSYAHVDDVVGAAEPIGRVEQMLGWPASTHLRVGPELFRGEIRRIASQHGACADYPSWSPFYSADDIMAAIEPGAPPAEHEWPHLSPEDIVAARKRQRELDACATKWSRKAGFHGQEPGSRAHMEAIVRGEAIEPPPEEAVREVKRHLRTIAEELPLEVRDAVIGNADWFLSPQGVQQLSAFLKASNTLELEPQPLFHFLTWRQLLDEDLRAKLDGDPDLMRCVFEAWYCNGEAAPGYWAQVVVAESLARNAEAKVKASESTDLIHISALPYVDVLFADGRIHDAVMQSPLPEWMKARCQRNGSFRSFLREPTALLTATA